MIIFAILIMTKGREARLFIKIRETRRYWKSLKTCGHSTKSEPIIHNATNHKVIANKAAKSFLSHGESFITEILGRYRERRDGEMIEKTCCHLISNKTKPKIWLSVIKNILIDNDRNNIISNRRKDGRDTNNDAGVV